MVWTGLVRTLAQRDQVPWVQLQVGATERNTIMKREAVVDLDVRDALDEAANALRVHLPERLLDCRPVRAAPTTNRAKSFLVAVVDVLCHGVLPIQVHSTWPSVQTWRPLRLVRNRT